jgi:hypothetical protein
MIRWAFILMNGVMAGINIHQANYIWVGINVACASLLIIGAGGSDKKE